MTNKIHIAIAEPSLIIRMGLESVLHRLPLVNIDVALINDLSTLITQVQTLNPNILIIDPAHIGFITVAMIKEEIKIPNLKVIALQNSLFDKSVLTQFDEVITIYDTANEIKDKLTSSIASQPQIETKQELSVREKEIVVCIVKGLTNKQIAEELFLSTHTVITHRRNITNKLQVHSTSGLTIYAIVNKLVEIDEVKNNIFTQPTVSSK